MIALHDNKGFNILCSLQLALFHMFLPSFSKEFYIGLEAIWQWCNHHGHSHSMDASSLWTPDSPCCKLEIWWLHSVCGLSCFELVTDSMGWQI